MYALCLYRGYAINVVYDKFRKLALQANNIPARPGHSFMHTLAMPLSWHSSFNYQSGLKPFVTLKNISHKTLKVYLTGFHLLDTWSVIPLIHRQQLIKANPLRNSPTIRRIMATHRQQSFMCNKESIVSLNIHSKRREFCRHHHTSLLRMHFFTSANTLHCTGQM